MKRFASVGRLLAILVLLDGIPQGGPVEVHLRRAIRHLHDCGTQRGIRELNSTLSRTPQTNTRVNWSTRSSLVAQVETDLAPDDRHLQLDDNAGENALGRAPWDERLHSLRAMRYGPRTWHCSLAAARR